MSSATSSCQSSESIAISPAAEKFLKSLNETLDNSANFVKLKRNVASEVATLFEEQTPNELYSVYFEILVGADDVVSRTNRTAYSNIIRKTLIREFSNFVDKKRSTTEGIEFVNSAATRLYGISYYYEKVIDVYFKSKCIKEFHQCILTKATLAELVSFLEKKCGRCVGEVLRWIIALPIKKCFDYAIITAHAVLNDDLSNLYSLCREDEEIRHIVVGYLNYVCADEYIGIDPFTVDNDVGDLYLNSQLRRKTATVMKVAFNMFKEFNMSTEAVNNCIYIRQMTDFHYVYKRYKKGEIINIEQTIAKAFLKGLRLRYSVLSVIAKSESDEAAVYYAMLFNVPEEHWPRSLQDNAKNLKALVETKVQKKREQIAIEQSQIEEGVAVNKTQDHRAFVVDSIEKIDSILKPFMAEPTEGGYVGMDAEWDASDCGQQGDLCLLQLSSRKKTIIVDVTMLSSILSEEQWVDVLRTIFDGDKKLIGFALHSDLQVLKHKFPYLLEKIPNINMNMICLHVAFNVINADPQKIRAVFKVPKAPPNNLAQISKVMLDYELSKEEQSSVWSTRPLRKEQLRYAARDSMAVYGIYGLTLSRLEDYQDQFDEIFKPVEWTTASAKKSLKSELEIDQNVTEKKTKSSHINKAELEEIVKKVNHYFFTKQISTVSSSQATYAYDAMCTQLAICLRRLGINVIKVPPEEDLAEFMMGHSRSHRILTSGKAARKFMGFEKVIDTSSSSEFLDVQIEMFLKKEYMAVDVDNYKARCENCNGRNFSMIPLPYLQYLHYYTLLQNEEKYGSLELDEDEVERHFEKMNSYVYPVMKYPCSLIYGKETTMIYTKNAIIDVNHLQICQLSYSKRGLCKGEATKLILSTHRSLKDIKESPYAVHGICISCGKENIDVVENPVAEL